MNMEFKKLILEGLHNLIESYNEMAYVVTFYQLNSKLKMQIVDVKPCLSKETAYKEIKDRNAVPKVFTPPKDRSILYYELTMGKKEHYF